MSFQAYLDAAEAKTGRTPRELMDLAGEHGFGSDTPAKEILAWLAAAFGLGRGHGMALAHVIRNGPTIPGTHVGTTGPHRDRSTLLRLDGVATWQGS